MVTSPKAFTDYEKRKHHYDKFIALIQLRLQNTWKNISDT